MVWGLNQKQAIINNLKDEVVSPLADVREELNDHLCSINENTDEIQSLYCYIGEVDKKMDAIMQRLQRVEMFLMGENIKEDIKPLNTDEKQVFLSLYTESAPLTYDDIALKNDIDPSFVKNILTQLVKKGIPITKTFYKEKCFVRLDKMFKERQAKENIVNLSLTSFCS